MKVTTVTGLNDVCFLSSSSVLFHGSDGLSIGSVATNAVAAVDGRDKASRIRALSFSPLSSKLALANDKNSVQLFTVSPDGTSLQYTRDVSKFTDHVLCVDVSSSGNLLVAGCASGEVRLWDVSLEAPTLKSLPELRFNGSVTAVAIDPRSEYYTVTSSEGVVRIFETATQNMAKKIWRLGDEPRRGESKYLTGKLPLSGCAFSPSGSHLALCKWNGQVDIYARDQWAAPETVLKCDSDAPVACIAYSPNGQYLACCTQHSVHVWDVSKRGVVSTKRIEPADSVVMRVRWSPLGNVLALVTASGVMQVWDNVIPDDLPEPQEPVGASIEAELGSFFQDDDDEVEADYLKALEQAEEQAVQQKAASASVSAAVESDDVTPQKRSLLKKSSGEDLNTTAGEDDVDVQVPFEDQFESPFSVTPVSGFSTAAASSALLEASGKVIEEAVTTQVEALATRFGLVSAASAFHPSATTRVSANANRRVLIWNRVGRAVCIDDRMESIVEVEFADMTLHRKIRVADLYSYNMGALSEAGVALAASAVEEAGTRAVVHFKPVAGLVGGAEWQELLEAGDDVEGVAIGDDWVAAVCSPYMYLRVWSVSGVQAMPIQLPITKFVSMVGQGTRLSIFHSTATGLSVLVYDFAQKRLVFNAPAPLTPRAELTWCGYTPTSVLVTVDSAGVGRMLVNSGDWQGQWMPLIQPEGRLEVDRKWPLGWPIGATDDSLIVVRLNETEEVETGLVLDDDNRGAPSIDTIRWNTPLAAPNSALSVGLEGVLRRRLMLSQSVEPNPRRELEIDSEIVKLVVLSAKNGLPQRALELFSSLRSNQTKMVAMKWVGSNGYDQLFSKMEARWREDAKRVLGRAALADEDDEDDDDEDEDEEEAADKTSLQRSGTRRSREEDEESAEPVTQRRSSDIFDDEAVSSATKVHKVKKNPFSAKKAKLRRSSSGSGGVMEALARIEARGK